MLLFNLSTCLFFGVTKVPYIMLELSEAFSWIDSFSQRINISFGSRSLGTDGRVPSPILKSMLENWGSQRGRMFTCRCNTHTRSHIGELHIHASITSDRDPCGTTGRTYPKSSLNMKILPPKGKLF